MNNRTIDHVEIKSEIYSKIKSSIKIWFLLGEQIVKQINCQIENRIRNQIARKIIYPFGATKRWLNNDSKLGTRMMINSKNDSEMKLTGAKCRHQTCFRALFARPTDWPKLRFRPPLRAPACLIPHPTLRPTNEHMSYNASPSRCSLLATRAPWCLQQSRQHRHRLRQS